MGGRSRYRLGQKAAASAVDAGVVLDNSWTTVIDVKGSKTKIAPGVWRLRVYVGRRANGTPIQLTRTFRGRSQAADRELELFVAEVTASREQALFDERVEAEANRRGIRIRRNASGYVISATDLGRLMRLK